jgi:hypothetical protein
MEQELFDWLLKQGPTIVVLGILVWRNGRMMEKLIERCMEKFMDDQP